jgi:radical SAM superfamily enzyme YgiQ (UPF0313 family)
MIKMYLLSIFDLAERGSMSQKESFAFPPPKIRSIAILSVAAAILKKYSKTDVDLQCIEGSKAQKIEDFIDLIKDATHIGFSIYSWSSDIFCSVAKIIKERYPHIILFAGGNSVTYYKERYSNMNLFDTLVIDEGEVAVIQMIDKWLKNEKVDSIIHVPIPDLTNIPSPWKLSITDLSILSTYSVYWEISRGCIFNCMFCNSNWGGYAPGTVRYFSSERIRDEVEIFSNYKEECGLIYVIDSTFNVNKRAIEILDLLANKMPKVAFTFTLRAEFFDENLAIHLSKLEKVAIRFGVQSIHTEVLKIINRAPLPKEKIIEVSDLCKKYSIYFGFDLIFGLPTDTYEGFCETIDFISSLEADNVTSFTLIVPDISEMFRRREEWKFEIGEEYPSFLLSSSTMSREDMARATRLSIVCNALLANGKVFGSDLIPLLKPLNMRPSEFLERLAIFLGIKCESRKHFQDPRPESYDNIKQKGLNLLEVLYNEKIKELETI